MADTNNAHKITKSTKGKVKTIKPNSQCQVYDFRANFENFIDYNDCIEYLHKIAKKFVFQLEIGKENNYKHWQGRLSLWKIKRKTELLKLLKGLDKPNPFNYLEPTTTEEHKKEAFYCMKEDSKIEGPWSDKDKAKYIPRQYRNIKLYEWQQQIVDSKDIHQDRIIDCIVDEVGKMGKSTIASICDLYYGGIDLPPINDCEKIISSLCDKLIAKQETNPKILFFDMPRALNKDKLHQLFTAMEIIKKGKVWDMRNSYKEWWFDSPRIWCFTNTQPDISYFSSDRWCFWEIDENKRLVKIEDK